MGEKYPTMNSHIRAAVTAAAAAAAALLAAQDARAQMFAVPAPVFDVWMYPPGAAGLSDYAPTFGSPIGTPDPDRLGYYFVCFDTSTQAPTSTTFRIISARLTIRMINSSTFSPTDGVIYDPTFDIFTTYLGNPPADPDPGRPIELYGAQLRSGLTLATWNEVTTPVQTAGVYNAVPIDFGDEQEPRNVQSNIDEGFNARPFAIGQTSNTYAAGGRTRIADEATITFDIAVGDAGIQRYFRESLQSGRVGLIVSSMHSAGEFGAAGADIWPRFATRETFGLPDPTLTLVVEPVRVGDFNFDNLVNSQDLAAMLGAWGACSAGQPCPADLTGDGFVNAQDLAQLLGNWG